MKKESMKDQMKKGVGGFSAKLTPPKDSLFQGASKSSDIIQPATPSYHASERVHQDKFPKADIYNQRVTLVISREQRDNIQKVAQQSQDNGLKKPERVTANTVVRCLINLLESIDIDVSTVKDEDTLNEVFRKHFINK